MKARTLLCVTVFALIAALTVVAQPTPTILAALESQKPKNGMVKQYEDGRKQKGAWHKQQNDPQPLYVWETLTGNGTGTYVVGRLNQHWADFDKPPVSDQAPCATTTIWMSEVGSRYTIEKGNRSGRYLRMLRGQAATADLL
jgi:hypothetical protein